MKNLYIYILFVCFTLISLKIEAQNASYKLNGNAIGNQTGPDGSISCNCFQLTSASNSKVGSVWNENKINLKENHTLEFDIYLGSNNAGADGMAFALQKLNTSIGVLGGGLGIENVSPSLGVLIDTYQNGSPYNDPAADHISIHKNGDPNHSSSNELDGPVSLANLEDNNWRDFKIDWNASSKTFNVFLEDMSTPILTHTGDIVNTIFGNDSLVYWGFTASTGGLNNLQKFCSKTDLESPYFVSCPSDIIVNLDGSSCSSVINYSVPSATDNCGTTNETQIAGLPTGSTFPFGVTTNTWVTTDQSGNTDTCSFNVTINGSDFDNDGISDLCDLDDDNDGILDMNECVISNFHWSNPPSGVGNTSSGVINGITYDYISDQTVLYSGAIVGHNNFPASYNIPNQTCIKNTLATSNTLNFNQPIINPVLVFASIGSGSTTVPINFSNPVEILWSFSVVQNSATSISGTGGNAIVRMNGTFSSISFDYLAAENYVNFAFGADFITFCDTDSDGNNDNFDLDSDNDGCLDVLEAGNLDPDNDGILGSSPVAVDANGQVINQNGYIGTSTNVIDNTIDVACNRPPIANCKDTIIYVDINCSPTILNNDLDDNSSDPDSDALIFLVDNNGPFNIGITNVTMTVSDPDGESDNCIATVTVFDTISPEIICPIDQNDSYDNNCQFILLDYTSLADTSDNCRLNPTISQFPAIGSIINSDTVISLTVTDAYGNSSSCNFNLFLSDTINPLINCPADQNDSYDTNCQFTLLDYTSLIDSSDNCELNHSVIQFPPIGSIVSSDTIITLTVEDVSGNSASCSFNLILNDTTRPVINCPGDQNDSYNVNCQFTLLDYTSLADTSDNCELSQSITQLPAIGSIINSDTIITLTALDASGNSSSCNFRLILNDTTAPEINCPIDQNDNYNDNCQFILLDYTSLADTSDNCELVQSISQIPAIGTIINSDTTLITLTSTDFSGNLSSCEFYLYLTDTTNPIITCPSDTIMDNDTLECGVFYNYLAPVGFDNCNSIITQNIGLSSGSLFPVGFTTNIFRITDDYGNYSSCSFYVLVNDVDPPLISCPNDTSIQFDNSCEYIIPNYLDEINFSDNCGIRSTFQSPVANSLINNDFSASIVITDSSGNASQCNFNVSLFDPNIQDIICPDDQTLMLGSDCKVLMPNYTDQLLVPSLCGSLKTIEQFPIENSLIDFIGVQEVLFTVTDSIGNIESCSFELSITNNDINNCNKIFIPNVFSPDGDLINDLFIVYGLELYDQYIEIYNRWGQMVYKSELSNVNWDGKFEDENVPSGTYVYSVFKNDGELKLKGTISLVR